MRKQLLKLLGVIMISVIGLSCNMDEDNFALDKSTKEETLKDQLEQIASKYNVGLFYNDARFGKKRIDLVEFEKSIVERIEHRDFISDEGIDNSVDSVNTIPELRVFPRIKRRTMEHHTPNPPYDGSFEDQRYVNVNNRSYWVEMSISWHVGGLFGPDYVSAPTFEVTGYNYLTVANFRYVFRGSYGSFVAFCDLQFGNISIFVSFDYDEDTGVGYLIYSV